MTKAQKIELCNKYNLDIKKVMDFYFTNTHMIEKNGEIKPVAKNVLVLYKDYTAEIVEREELYENWDEKVKEIGANIQIAI